MSDEKRILLTGGTGFIGRQVVAPLAARGFVVHLVAPPSETPPRTEGVAVHACDLFDREGVAQLMQTLRPTHLLHLAWYVEHGKFWTSPENARWTDASLRLLRDFAACGGRRAALAGTCAEYDWSGGLCREGETPLVPRSVYGQCKKALYVAAEDLAREAGLSLAWGRIFFLYGPGENEGRFVPSIIRSLLAGERAVCRAGWHVRDLMYVTDVADAFAALVDSATCGAVNVASGRPVALGQVARTIAEMLGRTDGLEVGDAAPTPDDPALIAADTRRLNAEVRWHPRVDLEEGLRQTIAWWKR